MREKIALPVVRRLPRYYRFLGEMIKEGITRTSSKQLSERMNLTASQIRQDLNCFGGFGQQGYGYNVPQLHEEIGHILGVDRKLKCVLIGAGNLGRTIAMHMNFEERGFKLIGIFDSNEAFSGQIVAGQPIRHMNGLDDFCRENLPSVAILCVPHDAASDIGDQLVALKIKGIWNFSHYDFGSKYPDIAIENVHLGDSLMTLGFRINNNQI